MKRKEIKENCITAGRREKYVNQTTNTIVFKLYDSVKQSFHKLREMKGK